MPMPQPHDGEAAPIINRAYSLLSVKSVVDEDERIIEGIASTPEPDRLGDVVDPMGAKFKLPMPLLWQHKHDQPIGHVTFAKPTKSGIPFRAQISKFNEPGRLKDRLDEAWHSIKAGLVGAVSIGFRSLKHDVMEKGGYFFKEWEWLELSAVTIPAHSGATLNVIRSIDAELRAASGREQQGEDQRTIPPGVSGKTQPVNLRPKDARKMQPKTVAEQISALEATRAAKDARMAEVMTKSMEDGRSTDADEQEEFDTLEREVEAIDGDLKRLAALEKAQARKATPVPRAETPFQGSEARSSIVLKHDLPKGTRFTRYAMALAAGRGSVSDAIQYAKRWESQTPEVIDFIKAAAGSTATATGDWGSELVYATNLVSEFVELLRPATIIGRINGIRRVPFNVRIPVQTGGSTVDWVGEEAVKPVTELDFSTITLGYDKIAGIVVLTEELVRLSSPSAEELVRRDLTEQIARFMDAQFLNPAITATANRPASITNGVVAVSATGTDADALYADLNSALAAFDDAEMNTNTVHLIMPPALARGISSLRNALGQFEFGGVSMAGGTLNGYPVVVSSSVPAGTIVIVKADDILMADDGQVRLDASNQATLDMAGGASPTFSLWQRNMIGIRAERWITWKKRRAEAVAVIDTAAYGPTAVTA